MKSLGQNLTTMAGFLLVEILKHGLLKEFLLYARTHKVALEFLSVLYCAQGKRKKDPSGAQSARRKKVVTAFSERKRLNLS